MYSEEAEYLKKELLDIRNQIKTLEHHNHSKLIDKKAISQRLEELKKRQEIIRFQIKCYAYQDYSIQNRGGRT